MEFWYLWDIVLPILGVVFLFHLIVFISFISAYCSLSCICLICSCCCCCVICCPCWRKKEELEYVRIINEKGERVDYGTLGVNYEEEEDNSKGRKFYGGIEEDDYGTDSEDEEEGEFEMIRGYYYDEFKSDESEYLDKEEKMIREYDEIAGTEIKEHFEKMSTSEKLKNDPFIIIYKNGKRVDGFRNLRRNRTCRYIRLGLNLGPKKDLEEDLLIFKQRLCPNCLSICSMGGAQCKHMICKNSECGCEFCFVCLRVKDEEEEEYHPDCDNSPKSKKKPKKRKGKRTDSLLDGRTALNFCKPKHLGMYPDLNYGLFPHQSPKNKYLWYIGENE